MLTKAEALRLRSLVLQHEPGSTDLLNAIERATDFDDEPTVRIPAETMEHVIARGRTATVDL